MYTGKGLSRIVLMLIMVWTISGMMHDAQGQTRPLGSWTILNGRLTLNERWNVWAEGQARSTRFYHNYFYYEVKGGLTYNLNDNISITVGTGRYMTFTTGGNFLEPLTQGETRTWFQLVMENQLGRVNFDHRYRVEQRFTTNGYRNRLRYRFNMVVPINRKEMIPTTWYAYLGDEIFFTNHAPYYERNRFFGGLGYKFTKALVVQAGFLRQYDYKIESSVSRTFLQMSMLWNWSLKDQRGPDFPKTAD